MKDYFKLLKGSSVFFALFTIFYKIHSNKLNKYTTISKTKMASGFLIFSTNS